jgi:outer membrane biosynthesis protein TonB
MFLAFILGMCLLPWSQARIVPSANAMATLQSGQAQERPDNSSPQSLPAQSPADQPGVQDQSATPPQPPATVSPCPEKTKPSSTARPDCKPAESSAAKTSKHRRTHRVVVPAGTPAEAGLTKKVVRNGGVDDPTVDLSGLSQQQVDHQIELTNQLLANSDADLKKISGRQLNANEQDAVKQIKSYLEQARKAVNDRDGHRAHNLAVKANLLLAELVGH